MIANDVFPEAVDWFTGKAAEAAMDISDDEDSEVDEEDDDEWISSGSGAATPQNVELEDTSSATDKNMMSPHADLTNGVADRLTNGVEELTTPRAEVQLELTCVDTARPDSSPTSRVQTQGQAQPPVVRIQPQMTPSSPESPSPIPTEPSEQMQSVTLAQKPPHHQT